jgi:hypothetical protein
MLLLRALFGGLSDPKQTPPRKSKKVALRDPFFFFFLLFLSP